MNDDLNTPHKRYQFKPFAHSSHSWAIDQFRKLPPSAQVLDVGPGSGAIGSYLKSLESVELISAVEIDLETIGALREQNIYQEIETDVEKLSISEFDCILLLDVLEHMANPFQFLEDLTKRLKPNGMIVISVPNIAHWSVRASLLFGYFEYSNRGILDRTHLQFFNRRRFLELCECCQRTSVELTACSLEPVEFVLPEMITNNSLFHFLRSIQYKLTTLFPNLFGYQHLGVLRLKQ